MDTETIRKCHKMLDKAWTKINNRLNKFKEFAWHEVKFEVWRAGFCHWNRIQFVFKKKVLYELKKDKLCGPSGDNIRKEYFKGRLVRTYDGCQNCFIEFCEALACLENFPSPEEFEEIGNYLKLEKEVIEKYTRMYKKLFKKNS
jgi:hypothetical protein